MPVNLFVSYCHADRSLCEKLVKHLKPFESDGLIKLWHDREITAGREFDADIASQLNSCAVILLLISPDFFNSDYCVNIELQRAMQRRDAGEALVIPIILRPVVWDVYSLKKLSVLPEDGKPVTSWKDRDAVLASVAKSVRDSILKFSKSSFQKNLIPTAPPATPVQPAAAASNGKIYLRFPKPFANAPSWMKGESKGDLKVYLDGREVGKLHVDETICLDAVPGYHYVEVKLLWAKSNKEFVQVSPDENIIMECGLLSQNGKLDKRAAGTFFLAVNTFGLSGLLYVKRTF